MKRENTVFLTGLAVFSVLTSFMFVYHAVGILNAAGVPQWDKVYGYVAIGYGLGNIYILSAAWRFRGAWALWADKLIAFCFFGVFAIDLWRTGSKNGLELVGALVMVGVLWLNWYAVKQLVQREDGNDRGATAGQKKNRGRR